MTSNNRSRVIPKQWHLTKTETINNFNNWKENQIYSLSIDDDFKPYLADGVTWGKKTAASPTRGLADDPNTVDAAARKTKEQKCAALDLLGQLANWATIISRHQITKNSTSLNDVWNKIREHYGFLGTGARFLDLATIKLDVGERPEDLYQRLLSFFEDNLLTNGSSVTHHGVTSTMAVLLRVNIRSLRYLHVIHRSQSPLYDLMSVLTKSSTGSSEGVLRFWMN